MSKQKKKGEKPLNVLREAVYPELYQSIQILIDYIIKTDELRKHQERLKKKKVFDKLEQRQVEKDRLKAELGSDYESSGNESLDFEELGLDKQELDNILQERMEKKIKEEEEEQEKLDKKGAGFTKDLDKIQEDEEGIDEEEEDKAQRKNHTEKLKKQREDDAFNPLKFLAQQLKDIHAQKITKK